MRVAILTGSDAEANRLCMARIAALPEVQIVGVLLDTHRPGLAQRVRNLRRNLRREGFAYAVSRVSGAVADALDDLAGRVISASDVDALLRRAFPDEAFSLEDFTRQRNIPLIRAGHLNGPEAIARLRALDADLGVVVGTRILKRTTFGVPRLGSINIHKGKVPEYRGLPPGFWELFEGAPAAGVTIHFVDDGLDSGDVIALEVVPIQPSETPVSLAKKLDVVGADLLARAVASIADGTVRRQPQPAYTGRPRTSPTRAQRRELAARIGGAADAQPGAGFRILKNLWHLGLFYGGIVHVVRRLRRRSRGTIVLYHRVNDLSTDVLTTSRRRFAEHLLCLRRYYRVRSSSWIAGQVGSGAFMDPTSVAIHFDDCYADVSESAAPLLQAAGLPAASFISSGFIDTDRRFPHDEDCPHAFRNMTTEQVRRLPSQGIEVGAHTVNHRDMGQVTLGDARMELEASKAALERITGEAVETFSFPYGQPQNFRADVGMLARAAGFRAIFSASGGSIRRTTSPWNIPRIGGTEGSLALYLLLEIEGLSLSQLRSLFFADRKRRTKMSPLTEPGIRGLSSVGKHVDLRPR